MKHDSASSTRQTDVIDADRANAMRVVLGQAPDIAAGDPLPPFFHQLYFWDAQPTEKLGRDGHPRTGTGLIPDMGLPRRMWAGGRLEFHAPLRAGTEAVKTSTIHTTTRKEGRTGPLAFVTLRHEIDQGGTTCITEYQDLVYREDASPDAPKPATRPAPLDEDAAKAHGFDTTMLFRYSALTFNGHRIHYDLDYARDVEGYAGLVTHGPLLAQLLMLMAERQQAPLRTFSFRAASPVMHFETVETCWKADGTMWVRGPDGRLCMEAAASR